MKNIYRVIYYLLLIDLFIVGLAHSEIKVKIKDIVNIDGLRDNQVFGFGLIVGLQGSGDSQSTLTRTFLKNLLKNLGLEEDQDFSSKNIAAVLITAMLPPFARIGDKIDITVSSIGDARSLEGGILVQSPLKGADDRIYVVAQGPLSIEHTQRRGRNIMTVARIIDGGIVEKEIKSDIIVNNTISLILKEWDFSGANKIIKSIGEKYPQSNPMISRGGRIKIKIPNNIDISEFISGIENIEISPQPMARVVVNERDGTIVMGEDVKISEVVVSKDGITVSVDTDKNKGNIALLKEASTVKDLMDSLNYIGVSTRDIISILKALKEAGALHAELIVR